MLNVKTLEEVRKIVKAFEFTQDKTEEVNIEEAVGRILAEDLFHTRNIPGFRRSTVDGYCVKASEVFGCTDSMPALLDSVGSVKMGEPLNTKIGAGQCAYIPTGGCMPEGTDSVVMVEYTEDFGDSIGILRPVAPGENVIFESDDAREGELLLKKGTYISSKQCGILAASGIRSIRVVKRLMVAVISSGNELIHAGEELEKGKIYDVNGPMLMALLCEAGCKTKFLGIMKDEEEEFEHRLLEAVEKYDMVLISGGTSVGVRDLTAKILNKIGQVLVHGIAVKPGKPTIIAKVKEKMVFGLSGNPMAAYFIFQLVVRNKIHDIYGYDEKVRIEEKVLELAISSNHGREEYIPVKIEGNKAIPVIGKSGLISSLKNAEGYIFIDRDCEGVAKGKTVHVTYF